MPVSVCGEMAADPVLLTLLVGLGLREFSMAPTAIPLAKQVVRGLNACRRRRALRRAARCAPRPPPSRTRDRVQFLAPLAIERG